MRVCISFLSKDPYKIDSELTHSGLYFLAKTLSKRGINVHIVANQLEKGTYVKDGIYFHNIPLGKNLLWRNLKVFNFFYRLNKKYNFDVVNMYNASCAIPIILFAKISRVPIIYSERNHYPWLEDKKEINPRVYWLLVKLAIKQSKAVTAASSILRKKILDETKISESCIKIIPMGMNLTTFQTQKSDFAKEKHAFNMEDPILLSVARVVPHKGHDFLIKAISIVKKDFPNVRALLIGPREAVSAVGLNDSPSSYYLQLVSLIKKLNLEKNVFFLGIVPKADLLSYYASADIFVLPTRKEGFGTVFMEAMASGRPIITCKLEPMTEVVGEKVGILVEPGNIKNLAVAIKKILSNQDLADKMSENAIKRVKCFYDINVVAEKKYQHFLEVLETK